MAKIYQRGEMWWSDYWLMGKRFRKPLSPNKREAQAMQDEMLAAGRFRRNGLIPPNLNFDAFELQYLRVSKSENSDNTYDHDQRAFKRLKELYPVRYINEVSPELLQDAQIKWKEKGYGPAAIGAYVMRMKVAMKTAEKWKYVAPQAWNIVKDYVSLGRMIYYTVEQFEKMASKAEGKWKTGLLLMCRAGLRSGEARHLSPDDVLYDDAMLWIRSKPCDKCKECRNDGNIWHPKGWTPRKPRERYVDIPPDLIEHLQSLPRGQRYVLGANIISAGEYARYYSFLVSFSGLRGSAHSFRHTYASWLISNGATLEQVGELLGHDDPKTTKIYSHLLPHARKAAIDKLPQRVPILCHSLPPRPAVSVLERNDNAV